MVFLMKNILNNYLVIAGYSKLISALIILTAMYSKHASQTNARHGSFWHPSLGKVNGKIYHPLGCFAGTLAANSKQIIYLFF